MFILKVILSWTLKNKYIQHELNDSQTIFYHNSYKNKLFSSAVKFKSLNFVFSSLLIERITFIIYI